MSTPKARRLDHLEQFRFPACLREGFEGFAEENLSIAAFAGTSINGESFHYLWSKGLIGLNGAFLERGYYVSLLTSAALVRQPNC
jgi:hypothetical protein